MAGEFFRAGMAADEAGEHARATSLYACCYHVVPHPNTLYNLALAAERADDVRTAMNALERYIAEAPDALNRAEAETLLVTVRERVAALPPEEPDAGATIEPLEDAGDAGAEPEVVAVADVAGVEASRPPPRSEWMSTTGWTLFGVGAASLAVGAGMGAWAADAADTVENSPQDTPWGDVAPSLDDFDAARAAMIAALAVGGALVVGGAVFLILDAMDETEAPVEAAVAPMVGTEAVGLAIVGRF